MPEAIVTLGEPAGSKEGFEAVSLNNKDQGSPDEMSYMERVAERVNGALTGFFFRVGLSIGTTPRKWLVGTFLVFLVFTTGVAYPGLTNENRSEKLWVPSDTQAQKDLTYVDGLYGSDARFGEVIVKPADGESALRPEIFEKMKTLVARIEAATVEWDGKTLTWSDQCFKVGFRCALSHFGIAFSGMAATDYDTEAEIVARANANPLRHLITQMPINVDGVMGGITRDASGAITGAKALRIGFLTQNNEVVVNGDGEDLRGDAYEQVLLDILNEPHEGLDLSFIVQRSFSDEFGNAINADLGLLQAAFVLILTYAALMLSKWDEGCVGSRVAVTFSGIVAIGLATGSAYGVCSMFGLFYSPLMNVLPFLLLGVGVDDMFVIVNAYDLETGRNPSAGLPVRIGRCLASAGASISVTSATDMFAFLIGSNTSLPALRNFCFYAAFGILFTFFFQCTWFVAWLTVDEWRRARNGRDVLCCLTVPKNACCVCCAPRPDGRTKMGRWMGDVMGGFLAKPVVKVATIAAFAAIAAGGFAGCALMQIDADVNNFIPGGSYLKEWIGDTNTLFRSLGDGISIFTRDFDITTEANAQTLLAASIAFKKNPHVAPESVRSWLEAFNTHRKYGLARFPNSTATVCTYSYQKGLLPLPIVQSDYSYTWPERLTLSFTYLSSTGAFANTELWSFVTSMTGGSYFNDIVWRNETNSVPSAGILVARITGNHVKSDTSNEKVRSMDSLRASLAAVPGNENGAIFAYSSAWLNYEQYKAIEQEAIRNISSTMAVMVVIIAFLLVNPKAVSVTCFCLCLIIVNIIGYMHFWGLALDSVTIIMLVIALGLSVDYAAHIGRAFMETHGTPDERLKLCLENMGVAVLNGAISTFLAVLLLSGSRSYVFITFFRQLFLCILFGLTHGLILLPVLMSIANPKPYALGAFGHG